MRHFRKRPSWRRVKKTWKKFQRIFQQHMGLRIGDFPTAVVTITPIKFDAAQASRYANNWTNDWEESCKTSSPE